MPRGIPLLGGKEVVPAQLLLVDLLFHCWRTWDQVRNWLLNLPNVEEVGFPAPGVDISDRLHAWSKQDPIYALMAESRPEPS